jgi:hypothetical protein
MKARTLNTIQGTIQDVRYMAEPVTTKAANANDPAKLTLSNRVYNFFDAWTEKSYNAWDQSGRPEREF